MSEFKEIKTQEEFDAAIGARLERERNSLEKKYAGFDDFKAKAEKYDALLEEKSKQDKVLEGLNKDLEEYKERIKTVDELAARAESAEKGLLKARVANECKLPFELASRITGDTEDDMRKDAELLAGFIRPATPAPLFSSTPKADNIAGAYNTLLEGLTAPAQ